MFRTEQMETLMSAGQQGDLTHETIPPQGRQHTAQPRPDTPQDDQPPRPHRRDAALTGQSTTPDDQTPYTPQSLERDINHLYPALPHPRTTRDLLPPAEAENLLPETERRLQERLHATLVAPVRQTVDHGGRLWRPVLAATVVDALGADSLSYGPLWASCELLHTGSLIIDDIQDEAPLRRGRPCAHLVHGTATAINAGTAAYFAFDRAIRQTLPENPRLRTAVYETYLSALRAAHAGQALDLQGHQEEMTAALETGDTSVLKQLVTLTHRLKSGAPVAAAFRIAALVAAADTAQCDALAALGEAVGTAYQITDDVADLHGVRRQNAVTKRVAEDLLNAKVTYPLVHAIACLPRDEAHRLWHQVRSGLDPDGAARAAHRIADCGALDVCVEEADLMVRKAWETASALLPPSSSAVALGRLCTQALRTRIA
ncbi:polyprenyl synthetase family protein [Streptomyces sp. NPDC093586]|uniref:polyprenyl synthetase family protein n=1 Tax=Streptomyces sp. NPDC093586 TaxID=3366042 RepID=UPI003824A922